MSKFRLAAISVAALVTVGSALAQLGGGGGGGLGGSPLSISTKQLLIKDNAKPAKRLVLALSKDPGVQFSGAGDPGTNGATIHVYSSTDDMCVILPGGAGWANKRNKTWKYSNKSTKNAAQIGNAKLLVRIKSGITFSLSDNGTQSAVNVQVQFGTGTRYCMRCSTAKKNTASLFSAKNCAAAACDPETSACGSTTSTTIASCSPTGQVLKGALTATAGRFNYNLTLGLPGAAAACGSSFPGTHVCTYAELQSAAAACDLKGLKDTSGAAVASFWAIDSSQPALQQCNDDVTSGLNWEYATAHTMSRGQRVTLDNAAGTLGALESGVQCNIAGKSAVGCCQ